MTYLFVLIIPVLILFLNYTLKKDKPKAASDWINLLLQTLPHEWGYVFFLYYIDREQNIDSTWGFLTLAMILLPLTVIAFLLKLFYWLKSKKITRDIYYHTKCLPNKNQPPQSRRHFYLHYCDTDPLYLYIKFLKKIFPQFMEIENCPHLIRDRQEI